MSAAAINVEHRKTQLLCLGSHFSTKSITLLDKKDDTEDSVDFNDSVDFEAGDEKDMVFDENDIEEELNEVVVKRSEQSNIVKETKIPAAAIENLIL